MVDLLTVGEAFDDFVFFGLRALPRLGEEIKTARFCQTAGGGAVITAVAAARLGLRSEVVAGLSEAAVALLRDERVRARNLRRASERPAVSVALSTGRDRTFVTFDGVNDRLERRLLADALRWRAGHVHFAFHPRDCRRWVGIIDRLRRRRVTTSWDFGWNPSLRRQPHFGRLTAALDFVFLNGPEAALYARRPTLAEAVLYWKRHARNAIIKLGARGSRWVTADLDLRASSHRASVVDTTGAGDAFNAGFLYGYLRRLDPRACLRVANAVGALSTRAAGGIDGLPQLAELRQKGSRSVRLQPDPASHVVSGFSRTRPP